MSHSSATDPNRLTRGSGYRPPNATKVNYCFHPPGRVPIRRFKRRLNVCGRHQDNKELQIQKALKGKLDRSRWLFSSLFFVLFLHFSSKNHPPTVRCYLHPSTPSIHPHGHRLSGTQSGKSSNRKFFSDGVLAPRAPQSAGEPT